MAQVSGLPRGHPANGIADAPDTVSARETKRISGHCETRVHPGNSCRFWHRLEDAAMFAPKVAGPHTKAAERTNGKLAPRRARAVARPFGGLGREAGGDHEQEAVAGGAPDTETPRGRRWSLSGISILRPDATPPVALQSRPPWGLLQPKLAIGSVDDPLEHEADRIADHVTRMPTPDLPNALRPSGCK